MVLGSSARQPFATTASNSHHLRDLWPASRRDQTGLTEGKAFAFPGAMGAEMKGQLYRTPSLAAYKWPQALLKHSSLSVTTWSCDPISQRTPSSPFSLLTFNTRREGAGSLPYRHHRDAACPSFPPPHSGPEDAPAAEHQHHSLFFCTF